MSKVTTQEQMDIIEAARNIVDKTPEEVEGMWHSFISPFKNGMDFDKEKSP